MSKRAPLAWHPHRPVDPRDVIDHHDWVVVRREWELSPKIGESGPNRLGVRLTPYHRHWTGPWDGLYTVDLNNNKCSTCGEYMPEFIAGFLKLADWSLTNAD